MSLSSDTARVQYTLTGSGQTLTVTFKFLAPTDFAVIKTVGIVDTTLNLNTDYTVTGGGSVAATGAVIMTAGATGDIITIYRNAQITQPSVYDNNGAFPAKTTETSLDRTVMAVQQLGLRVARALRLPISRGELGELLPATWASKILGFDVNGIPTPSDPVALTTPTGTVIEVSSYTALRNYSVSGLTTGRQARVSGYSSSGDGGDGLFVYDSASTATDDNGTILAPAVGSGRWVRCFTGAVSPMWFGAKGDGSTNDLTAVAAALAAGYSEYYFPSGTYVLGSTGITIPSTAVKVIFHPSATVSYTGTGTAITIATHSGFSVFDLGATKTVADWDPATGSGSDTTSIGIKLVDTSNCQLTVRVVNSFCIGAQILSDGVNSNFNSITLVSIAGNKIGLQVKKTGGGACNQNVFYGGIISIGGSHTSQLSGSRYLDVENGNGNTFVGTGLEGSTAEYSLYVNDQGNVFINNRFEGNQAGAIKFTSSGNYNHIIDGIFDAGNYSIITDLGGGNCYSGALGHDLDGAVSADFPINVRNGTTGRKLLTLGNTIGGHRLKVGNSTDGGGMDVAADGTFGDNVVVSKAQNGITLVNVKNLTSGTGAASALQFTNDAAGTDANFIFSFSTGYTTSNENVAKSFLIQAQNPAGLGLSALTGPINFWTGSTRRGTVDNTGLKIVAGFGCNGKTQQGAYSLGSAATDLPTVLVLANNIRLALIANGIGS